MLLHLFYLLRTRSILFLSHSLKVILTKGKLSGTLLIMRIIEIQNLAINQETWLLPLLPAEVLQSGLGPQHKKGTELLGWIQRSP